MAAIFSVVISAVYTWLQHTMAARQAYIRFICLNRIIEVQPAQTAIPDMKVRLQFFGAIIHEDSAFRALCGELRRFPVFHKGSYRKSKVNPWGWMHIESVSTLGLFYTKAFMQQTFALFNSAKEEYEAVVFFFKSFVFHFEEVFSGTQA
ncbi:MAG: hypothetical protein GY862_33905 [Gammaproteobacteria bacterium]|nr:hypothetical protein [Gammaproteobacteria bacterium]